MSLAKAMTVEFERPRVWTLVKGDGARGEGGGGVERRIGRK